MLHMDESVDNPDEEGESAEDWLPELTSDGEEDFNYQAETLKTLARMHDKAQKKMSTLKAKTDT